jgi:nitrate reductase (cytochrome), electron transfer subunit
MRRTGYENILRIDEMQTSNRSSPSTNDSSDAPARVTTKPSRWITFVCACIMGLAFVGFLLGIRPQSTPPSVSKVPEMADSTAATVKDYRSLGKTSASRIPVSLISELKFLKPDLFSKVDRTDEMKADALADRAKVRAYDGAPPMVPHPIDQQSAASCLACHAQGIVLSQRVATRISHPHYTSCTQCHVETSTSGPNEPALVVENEFAGIDRSGSGVRALVGSPPVIPHTTWMRNDCLSCHGLVARAGIRTTHPWLSNCQQCHAPSAELDQKYASIPH